MTKTATLSRQYDRLTARERVSLLAAAWGRDDTVEANRLLDSAPGGCFRLPDHFGLVEALRHLALVYLIQQLDLAALFWQATSVAEEGPCGAVRRSADRRDRCEQTSRLVAYTACVRAEGWRRFCAGLLIQPDDLLRGVAAYDTACRFEEVARDSAFSEAEAFAYLGAYSAIEDGKAGSEPHAVVTAAAVAASMQRFLDEAIERWS